jgi:hypothetical protein
METTVHTPQQPAFGRKHAPAAPVFRKRASGSNAVVSSDRCASGRSRGQGSASSAAAPSGKGGSLFGGMFLFAIALVAFGIAFSAFGLRGPVSPASANLGARITSFSDCGYGARENCVLDGGSFLFHGDRIQLAGIVTPDRFSSCAEERDKGAAAQARLVQLLNAGAVALTGDGETANGRLVREAHIGNASIGEILIDEGLALREGSRRSWCA